MAEMIREFDSPAGVLSFAREQRCAADRAEAFLLGAAVDWAAMHSVDSIFDGAAGVTPTATPRSPSLALAHRWWRSSR